ncbi:hypothetical protein FQN55_007281 [Onygenales sp. PD_40]|nr:hypothetical protein FQN55_007281 [Onygenales sp. PD_40]
MRLQAALTVLASLALPSSLAIFVDEAYHIDYHHALLGTPQEQTTFFHKPSTSSAASLLYTLSEKYVLGAVNPKDGAIVWRQNLASSAAALGAAEPTAALRAVEGEDTVVSAIGGEVASWGALDGKLAWKAQFLDGPVADLEILSLEESGMKRVAKDSVVVFGSEHGVVRRLDGASGTVKWEYKDDSDDIPFQVSTSQTAIYYISLQSATRKGYKIKVTALDLKTGHVAKQYTLSSEGEVSAPDSIIFVGSNSVSPLIAWMDSGLKTVKINVIGTKHIHSMNIENESGEEVEKVQIHAPSALNAEPHFLIHYSTGSKSWAEVYHTDLQSSAISKAYQLPLIGEKSVFATSNKDANVYFTRITPSEISVVSSASHGILGRWTPSKPSTEGARHAVSEVVARGSTYAVRFAQVLDSGDWTLVRNGEAEWTRVETLTEAVAAGWADVNGGEKLARELEVEGHQSLVGAYIHRLKRHAKDLEHLPAWLQELPVRVLTSFLSSEGTDLGPFGLGKLVIVATKKGYVLALDYTKKGSVVWKIKAVEGDDWKVRAIDALHSVVTVYIADGSFLKLNASSGEIIERGNPTEPLESIALIPSDGTPVTVRVQAGGVPDLSSGSIGSSSFVITLDNNKVLGWSTANPGSPVWEFVPPHGQKLIHATSRPSHDPVASIGKVLGNRSVLYKYLNPNLALLTTVSDSTVTFYLLDAVSGQVLHTITQAGVDTTQPISSAISENWFVYSLWADVTDTSDSKGYQLVISELYESPIPNDRGPQGDAANYSSIDTSSGTPRPHVISQAYVIPEAISTMAVSQTRQGITTKQLLCSLPASNAIVGIPRQVLDPRRPVGRDPSSIEAEEGLMKYSPFLDFDGRWYLTHAREVIGIKEIRSSPTLLESTSLVFAYGLDVFGTRINPSQAFDILGKGFSKVQLALTVVALGAGVAMLAPIYVFLMPHSSEILDLVKYFIPGRRASYSVLNMEISPFGNDEYTVGWICALQEVFEVATAMLTDEHGLPQFQPEHDNNVYILGNIGPHKVAMACLPAGSMGIGAAAVVAKDMHRTFKSLRFNVLVGIGGGVPNPKTGKDIRLGDVVVSIPNGTYGGVVQYNYGKTTTGGVFQRRGHLNAPPPKLCSYVTALQALINRPKNPKHYVHDALLELENTSDEYKCPKHEDLLFDWDSPHIDDSCPGAVCGNCDKTALIERKERKNSDPVIHLGTIASGDMAIRDSVERDRIDSQYGNLILCFEMEAAGLMNNFPCLVIRGISNYADSHKHDHWRSRAIAAASAYTKALLNMIVRPDDISNLPQSTESMSAVQTIDQNATQVQERLKQGFTTIQKGKPPDEFLTFFTEFLTIHRYESKYPEKHS